MYTWGMTEGFENKDIEKLAGMVARGFDDVYRRFDNLEKSVDKRFNEVHKRIDDLDIRMEQEFGSNRPARAAFQRDV